MRKYSMREVREAGYSYDRDLQTWVHWGYGKRYESYAAVQEEMRKHREQRQHDNG